MRESSSSHYEGHPNGRNLELARHLEATDYRNLGPLQVLDTVPSLRHGPNGIEQASFNVLPENITYYPAHVLQALAELHDEYNRSFAALVAKNQEFPRDYQFCLTGPDGTPVNRWTQIDMVGLPPSFLEESVNYSVSEVKEELRGNMFEIENSLAMYGLLQRMFDTNGEKSFFDRQFRASLDDVRKEFGMPIALLAVTDDKYEAMRMSEFGKRSGEKLTDEEVMEYSGFDTLMGPNEFAAHVAEMRRQGKDCGYLLYARTSDPVSKLKDPSVQVDHPLLSDPYYREIIKAYTLTMNIDNPSWDKNDRRRINDTKEHLPSIGMGFAVEPGFQYDESFWPRLREYLALNGVSQEDIESGKAWAHFKPMFNSYGAYGHFRGEIGKQSFVNAMIKTIEQRGPLILQREMKIPRVQSTNSNYPIELAYIHRNFFYHDGYKWRFLGGFNNGMPVGSTELKKGRVHGNGEAHWGLNLPKDFVIVSH